MEATNPVDENKEFKLYCNSCRSETYHLLLKKLQEDGREEWGPDEWLNWLRTYEMFQCRGCKSVLMRQTYADSEMEGAEVRYYPPKTSRHKQDWFYRLPGEAQVLLSEIYKSLDANNTALPLMGARALLDLHMVDRVGDVGNFVQKLEALEANGYLSKKNRELLEAALDAGNAASHRGFIPRASVVNVVMDIVENLLQAAYVLEDMAADLRKAIPPRPSKRPNSSNP